MDKINRIIEYHEKGYSKKKISRLLGLSKNTVKKYIKHQILKGTEVEPKGVDNGQKESVYHSDTHRDQQLESQLPKIIMERLSRRR